jgi:hypothetical protein
VEDLLESSRSSSRRAFLRTSLVAGAAAWTAPAISTIDVALAQPGSPGPEPQNPPTAVLEATTNTAAGWSSDSPQTATTRAWAFRGINSSDPDNDLDTWSLQIVEPAGTTNYMGNFAGSPPTQINHVFESEGTVNQVTLTVTDSTGQPDSDSISIVIQFPPPPG